MYLKDYNYIGTRKKSKNMNKIENIHDGDKSRG